MSTCIQYARMYCDSGVYKADVVLSADDGSAPDTFLGLAVTVSTCEPFCATVEIPDTGTVCPDGGTFVIADSPDATCFEGSGGGGGGGSGIDATLIDSQDGAGALPRTLTFSGVTVPAGARLIVAAYAALDGGVTSVAADIDISATFIGSAMTTDVSRTHGDGGETIRGGLLVVFSSAVVATTTGDIEVTFDLDPAGDGGLRIQATALYVTNLTSNVVDKTASATAHSASPSTGTTATTTAAAEYIFAAFGVAEASDTPIGFNLLNDFDPGTGYAIVDRVANVSSVAGLITCDKIVSATGTYGTTLVPDPVGASTMHAGVVATYK